MSTTANMSLSELRALQERRKKEDEELQQRMEEAEEQEVERRCEEVLNTELLGRLERRSTLDVDVGGAEFSRRDILQ